MVSNIDVTLPEGWQLSCALLLYCVLRHWLHGVLVRRPFETVVIQETSMTCIVGFPRLVIDSLAHLLFGTHVSMCSSFRSCRRKPCAD